MPIIVDFNYDVARSDRAAVEDALEVVSDVPVTGAWFWASDSEVVFRTQNTGLPMSMCCSPRT